MYRVDQLAVLQPPGKWEEYMVVHPRYIRVVSIINLIAYKMFNIMCFIFMQNCRVGQRPLVWPSAVH